MTLYLEERERYVSLGSIARAVAQQRLLEAEREGLSVSGTDAAWKDTRAMSTASGAGAVWAQALRSSLRARVKYPGRASTLSPQPESSPAIRSSSRHKKH